MLLTLMPGWRDFTRDLPLNHIRMKAGPGILEGKGNFWSSECGKEKQAWEEGKLAQIVEAGKTGVGEVRCNTDTGGDVRK